MDFINQQMAIVKLSEHKRNGSVHKFFVSGTCGESPSLSHHLKRIAVETACACSAGRIQNNNPRA